MKNKIIKNVVYVAILVLCIVAIVMLVKPCNYIKEQHDAIVAEKTPIYVNGNYAGYSVSSKNEAKFLPYSMAFAIAFTTLGVTIAGSVYLLFMLDVKPLLKRWKEKKQKTEQQNKLDKIARLEKELQELRDD